MSDLFESSIFAGVTISLLAYMFGSVLKKKLKIAILNPLLVSIIVTIVVLVVADVDYDVYNEGAKYLSWFLTPATVCLAIPLYEQWELLKHNYKAVLGGIVAGVITSLTTVLVLCKVMGLSHKDYVTLLPKSITTAIGMGVSEELGRSFPPHRGRGHGCSHSCDRSDRQYNRRDRVQDIPYQRTYIKGTCPGIISPCHRNCQGDGDRRG